MLISKELKVRHSLAFIDFRALSFFRIVLAALFLYDLINKTASLGAFYTDDGIYPISLFNQSGKWWSWSFHALSGSWIFQFLMMGIGVALGVALLVGYKTRFVTLLCWIFTLSLHNKNPLILHAGDGLLRLLFFWSVFLDLSRHWSVDSFHKTKLRFKSDSCGFAQFAILLQLVCLYFFTGLLKNDPIWTKDFSALYYVFNLNQFATPFGSSLLRFPILLKILTAATLVMELMLPWFIFCPWKNKFFRLLVPIIFIGFHLSLFFTMYLGTFPWVCMAAWFLVFPKEFWDKIEQFFLPKFLKTTKMVPRLLRTSQVQKWGMRLKDIFILSCLVLVTIWNVYTLPSFARTPSLVRTLVLPLRIDQHWAMFAPSPMKVDGWFVIEGELLNGETFDPWAKQKEIQWLQPKNVFASYRNSTQWRKYMTNVWITEKNAEAQRAFGKFICREHNRLSYPVPQKDKQLSKYRLNFLKKYTQPEGAPEEAVDKEELWVHTCFK